MTGLVVGSPVYYGGPNGSLCALLDRVFYSLGQQLQYKPGTSVVVCRRGGASAAFDRLNKYFTKSRPELLLARFLHPALALGTCSLIPDTYLVTAALQAQSAHLAPVGWCDIGDDATHDDVLNRLAVRTRHRRNLLTKQTTTLIYLGLVAAVLAAILQFPSHAFIRLSPQYKS